MFKPILVVAVLLLLCACAFCQQQPSRHEVSGGATYSFTTSSTFQGPITITENPQAVLKPSSAAGFLGSYQYHLTPRHGLQVNYGWFRNTQAYQVNNTLTGLPLPSASVTASVQELTGAYVFHVKKIWLFNPFLEGGAGVLFFGPKTSSDVTVGLSSEQKAVYLYGGGADVKISPKVSVRAQYRGLLYWPPDFNVFALAGFGSGSIAHVRQPMVGVVYRF
jgi:opacity protein-like surface antigen